jgi:hypothetical protein
VPLTQSIEDSNTVVVTIRVCSSKISMQTRQQLRLLHQQTTTSGLMTNLMRSNKTTMVTQETIATIRNQRHLNLLNLEVWESSSITEGMVATGTSTISSPMTIIIITIITKIMQEMVVATEDTNMKCLIIRMAPMREDLSPQVVLLRHTPRIIIITTTIITTIITMDKDTMVVVIIKATSRETIKTTKVNNSINSNRIVIS